MSTDDDPTDGALDDAIRDTDTVDPVPGALVRLYDMVDEYQLSRDVDRGIATELNVLYEEATHAHDAARPVAACTALTTALAIIDANEGTGVQEPAHDDLRRETKRVSTALSCE